MMKQEAQIASKLCMRMDDEDITKKYIRRTFA